MARRKRFNSEKAALSFAKKVSGKVNDLRNDPVSKSKFSVTYQPSKKTKVYGKKKFSSNENDWCPEEDRDFGYPNWYWKD